jgi:hypothetical protein
LVHRRCADSKAAVRKGALQLLEHLVVMRASWQGYPKQLPGAEDLLLLEAATADPLVSVHYSIIISAAAWASKPSWMCAGGLRLLVGDAPHSRCLWWRAAVLQLMHSTACTSAAGQMTFHAPEYTSS